MQHLIETRFSVLRGADRGAFSSHWLEQRLELWRRFCLPSILAQTVAEFTWLVLCDESTDPEALDALRSFGREAPMLEVVLTGAERSPAGAVRSRLEAGTEVLITTQLDSDDAVADRFVEAIQGYAEPFARSEHASLGVNFVRGYRLDVAAGALYEDRMANSSFPSLMERPGGSPVETALGPGHVMLSHLHPTHQDESMHAWLIAVHGGNLVNKIGGRQRAPGFSGEPIPGFPEGVISPPPATEGG